MSELIFIADDEPSVRNLAAAFVESLGFRALTFRDGMSVIEHLSTPSAEKPSLVISDIEMPRLNGIELKLRLMTLLPGVPVVIMSGMLSTALKREFPEEAANVIKKPFSRGDVEAAIKREMGRVK